MQFWNKHYTSLLVVVLIGIIFLGTFVRLVNLPAFNFIKADEETWLLSGLSLLKTGEPESWTAFWETYDQYYWSYAGGETRVVVRPYLDHPPLFQLFMGGWAVVTGNNGDVAFDWMVLRIPMILIAMLTIITTSFFVSKVFSFEWGAFTLFSFIVIPSHIVSSRIIAAEHLIALLLVGTLLACYWQVTQYSEKKPHTMSWPLFLILLLSFLAPLLKLSGIVVPLVAGLILLSRKQYFATLFVGVSLVLSIFAFVLYGCYYDCNLFWSVMQQHGLRPQTFEYFFTLFSKPDLGYYQLNDPMMLLGLVGSLVAIFTLEEKEDRPVKIFLLAPWVGILFLFMTLAPVELYGWYKYMVFPLVAIGLGFVWQRFLKGEYAWGLLIVPAALLLFENVFQFESDFYLVRKIIIAAMLVPLVLWCLKPEWVKKPIYAYWACFLLITTAVLQLGWSEVLLPSF